MTKGRVRAAYLRVLRETQAITMTFCALGVLQLRNAHSCYLILGAIAAAWTAKLLKHCIRQPRPTGSGKVTYGMPSTHSSSMAFIGVYLALCFMLLEIHPRARMIIPGANHAAQQLHGDKRALFGQSSRLLFAAVSLLLAVSVCWSRVRLDYHTKEQVLAGAALGTTVACLAFAAWLGTDTMQELTGRHTVLGLQGGFQQFSGTLDTLVENGLFALRDAYYARDYRIAVSAIKNSLTTIASLRPAYSVEL
ncbi:uncharacterized protein L969DRAFT_96866 [Mixia osmundae IAM 14324]|uniref:Phosphatidic acid phosphatase type 2/haloperoxidase domain-containing protein n=1 Tax=Mixia osmundae (strain CBS 9802 / IAM 14324 / JCM 22182 / KY 12970) TaxID=764103 RepID=G7E2B6_MIXOS|nr:uncharacterized protein L969DRAFT_96866 [Mixia osmundae IAM 14324]KEI36848.1 hypothetical protein L969DRAFT_96866 [Mixia osmundae IAM 14324]GAA96976.1 hypothetical protein E5Q_03650 [Mixia osmundae IAM 14324]